MDRNISLTYHYGMLKPYTKTNTGLEVQAKLSPNSHILILNGHAWGIQNDVMGILFYYHNKTQLFW